MSVETISNFDIDGFISTASKNADYLFEKPDMILAPLTDKSGNLLSVDAPEVIEVDINKILQKYIKDTPDKKQVPVYEDFQPKPIITEVTPAPEPEVKNPMRTLNFDDLAKKRAEKNAEPKPKTKRATRQKAPEAKVTPVIEEKPLYPLGPQPKLVIDAPTVTEVIRERSLAKARAVSVPEAKPVEQPKVEASEALAAPKKKITPRDKKVAPVLGRREFIGGVAATTVLGVVFGAVIKAENNNTAAASATETEVPTTTTTTEAPTTTVAPTTTEAPTTTTTESPAPQEVLKTFEAKPGDMIGTLSIPAVCEDINIFEYKESEVPLFDTGKATIDTLVPDPNGAQTCVNVDEYEAAVKMFTGRDYLKRSERLRPTIANAQNPDGHVSYYVPIAGHEQRDDGGLISVYPGQRGNTWFIGHGSMFSAPFANNAVLKPGDTATFRRSDGKIYNYEVIETQIVTDNDDEAIRLYDNPNYPSTITLSNCSDAEGKTGDKSNRYVVRFGLVSAN